MQLLIFALNVVQTS